MTKQVQQLSQASPGRHRSAVRIGAASVGATLIGNSGLFEYLGNVGIGTVSPQATRTTCVEGEASFLRS